MSYKEVHLSRSPANVWCSLSSGQWEPRGAKGTYPRVWLPPCMDVAWCGGRAGRMLAAQLSQPPFHFPSDVVMPKAVQDGVHQRITEEELSQEDCHCHVGRHASVARIQHLYQGRQPQEEDACAEDDGEKNGFHFSTQTTECRSCRRRCRRRRRLLLQAVGGNLATMSTGKKEDGDVDVWHDGEDGESDNASADDRVAR